MATDNRPSWYRRTETEDDTKGTQIIGPHQDENGDEVYLAHGGDQWRPPWTY